MNADIILSWISLLLESLLSVDGDLLIGRYDPYGLSKKMDP
jgi:hypothetical protein